MKLQLMPILTVFFILTSCLSDKKSSVPANKDINMQSEYKIDNKMVTKEAFDKFLKELIELPHTWFCAETTNGGITGYDAKDRNGIIWEYRAASESGANRTTLTKKFIMK
jgi:hypothetical protein